MFLFGNSFDTLRQKFVDIYKDAEIGSTQKSNQNVKYKHKLDLRIKEAEMGATHKMRQQLDTHINMSKIRQKLYLSIKDTKIGFTHKTRQLDVCIMMSQQIWIYAKRKIKLIYYI